MSPSLMMCVSATSLLSPLVVKLRMPLTSSIAAIRCVLSAYSLSMMVWNVTMSPTSSFEVSHFWMMMRSPLLNVGAMESDCTASGVKPAMSETLPSSCVASVVNAYKAATRMMIHMTTLSAMDATFLTDCMMSLTTVSDWVVCGPVAAVRIYCSSMPSKRIETE